MKLIKLGSSYCVASSDIRSMKTCYDSMPCVKIRLGDGNEVRAYPEEKNLSADGLFNRLIDEVNAAESSE